MRITAYHPESDDTNDVKPELCMYRKEDLVKDLLKIKVKAAIHAKQGVLDTQDVHTPPYTGSGRIHDGSTVMNVEHSCNIIQQPGANAQAQSLFSRVAWAWMPTLIQVKTEKKDAPFGVQDGKLVITDTKGGRRTRAQMSRYAAEVQLRQHRKFFFSAITCGRLAWLMRWDRAGAIVSLPFDYTKEPERLLNFAYRIARADPSGQGYDPTVCLASESEIARFDSYKDSLPSDSTLRKYAQEIFDNLKYHPMHKVCTYSDTIWLH